MVWFDPLEIFKTTVSDDLLQLSSTGNLCCHDLGIFFTSLLCGFEFANFSWFIVKYVETGRKDVHETL